MKPSLYSKIRPASEIKQVNTQFKVASDEIKSSVIETKQYIQSRGQNLVTNGTGLLGDNTNFPSSTFDKSDAYASNGSFTFTGEWDGPESVELIPVNPDNTYRFKYYTKAKPLVGTPRIYGYVASYDADGDAIQPSHTMYRANTLTTLAATLSPGATTVRLTNSANWLNTGDANNSYQRSFIFWNFVNKGGYAWPENTYSRNYYTDMWNAGGINTSTHTITLKTPWAGPTIPSGTKVSNGDSGGALKYIAGAYSQISAEWQPFSGTMGGIDTSGQNDNNKFHPGTASVKIGWLCNINGTGSKTWLSNISFEIDHGGQIDALKTRVSEAEQKITADSIVSTVRNSTSYTNDLGSKLGSQDFTDYKSTTGTSNDWKSSKSVTTAGWYRIAYNVGDRAFAQFTLKDNTSGQHQTAIFNTGITFGNTPSFTLTGFSSYSSVPVIDKVRIVKKGTYDPVYFEIYARSASNLEIFCRDNIQASGWYSVGYSNGEIPVGYTAIEYSIGKEYLADSTGQNTAKDTANVAGVPAEQIKTRIETAESDIIQKADEITLKVRKTVMGEKVVDKSVANFVGKVAGSTIANPHIGARRTAVGLGDPNNASLWVEHSSAGGNAYSRIDNLDGQLSSTITTLTVNTQAQERFSFNLIEHVQRTYGTIPGSNTSEKVSWLKTNVSSIVLNWWGYGSSAAGNKATFSEYLIDTSKWAVQENAAWGNSHTSGSVQKLPKTLTVSRAIDSNGFVHAVAYAENCNGTVASIINTDYVEMEVQLSVNTLSDRLSAAEIKITDNAIVSTVRASTDYANDLSKKAEERQIGLPFGESADYVILLCRSDLSGTNNFVLGTIQGRRVSGNYSAGKIDIMFNNNSSGTLPSGHLEESSMQYTDSWSLVTCLYEGGRYFAARHRPGSFGLWDRQMSFFGNIASSGYSLKALQSTEVTEMTAFTSAGSFKTPYTNAMSEITQQADKIKLVVSADNKILGDKLVSAINLEPTNIKIESKNIDIVGAVTFSSLEPGLLSTISEDASLLNVNPTFSRWTSTYPEGYVYSTGAAPTKVASDNGKPNAVQVSLTAGTSQYMHQNILGMGLHQYVTVEATFKLVSGGVGGAGILTRFANSSDGIVEDFHLNFKQLVPSPVIGRWYTVSKTFKAASITNVDRYRLFVMAGWTSFGTIEAKTIQFDSVKFRPALESEVQAYDTKGTVESWRQSGKTTINGGAIETNTISVDALKAGTISADKITISSASSGVVFNSSGITATKGSVVVSMNSGVGFKITNSGQDVFRVESDGMIYAKGLTTISEFNNLKIGARNLFIPTDTTIGREDIVAVKTSPKSFWIDENWYYPANRILIGAYEDFTISFWAKPKSGTPTAVTVHPVQYDTETGLTRTSSPSNTINVGTDWTYIVYTGVTAAGTKSMDCILRTSPALADNDLWINAIKVEKGNRPTDWTPAPEIISGDITGLDVRTQKAEEILFEEGQIASTVLSSTEFADYMIGKADASALGDYATITGVESIKKQLESYTDTAVGAIDLSAYAKSTDIQQTEDRINFKITSAGGVNMLQNSVGWTGLDFWEITSGVAANVEVVKGTTELEGLGAGSAWKLNAQHIMQTVAVQAGQEYTFSCLVKKTTSDVGGYFRYDTGNGTWIHAGTYLSAKAYNWEMFTYTFTATGNTARIKIEGLATNNPTLITNVMLNKGALPMQWTHAKNEIYNTNVQFNLNGIVVKNNATEGETRITPTEFAGYARNQETGQQERIFTLNGDTTEVKKLQAREEFAMGSMRILEIDNGTVKGWAFLARD